MISPCCKKDSKVLYTRSRVIRRRECLRCGKRFTTKEVIYTPRKA